MLLGISLMLYVGSHVVSYVWRSFDGMKEFSDAIAWAPEVDVVFGLDISQKVDNKTLDEQKEVFKKIVDGIPNKEDVKLRIGVFGYDDKIVKKVGHKAFFFPSPEDIFKEITDLSSDNKGKPYIDHALRFALATFEYDRANNEERGCSNKIFVLAATGYGSKWSDGNQEINRLTKMGIGTILITVNANNSDLRAIGNRALLYLTARNFATMNDSTITSFINYIIKRDRGSCCHTTPLNTLVSANCSRHIGEVCSFSCRGDQNKIKGDIMCHKSGEWDEHKVNMCNSSFLHMPSLGIGLASSALLSLILIVVIVCFMNRRQQQNLKVPLTDSVFTEERTAVNNPYSKSMEEDDKHSLAEGHQDHYQYTDGSMAKDATILNSNTRHLSTEEHEESDVQNISTDDSMKTQAVFPGDDDLYQNTPFQSSLNNHCILVENKNELPNNMLRNEHNEDEIYANEDYPIQDEPEEIYQNT